MTCSLALVALLVLAQSQDLDPVMEPIESRAIIVDELLEQAEALELVDPAEAFEYWLDAAHAGVPQAMHVVATRLHDGTWVRRDRRAAAAWWRQAAGQDHVTSAYNFGWCRLRGHGVTRCAPDAVRWLGFAAQHGHVDAMATYASCLSNGIAGPCDSAAAVVWWSKAAKHGHVQSMRALALAWQFGRGVKANVQKASLWWKRAAEGGDVQAMLVTAAHYEIGHGLPRDVEQADDWYAKASYLLLPAPRPRVVDARQRLICALSTAPLWIARMPRLGPFV